MKLEIEVTEAELNAINAALRMMDHFLHEAPCESYVSCLNTQNTYFRDSGFDEPTTEDIDALVHKIIGGDE